MSNRTPQVSIGMPVYNAERFLREALDALLAQDHTHFELVISDNGSTDGTREICREYAERDGRISYHRVKNTQSVLWNFNRVFELSRGEYFMWAAYDDLWEPTFISSLLEPLLTVPDCVASFSHVDVWNRAQGNRARCPGGMPSLSLRNSKFENFRQLLLFPQSSLFYGLYRRKALAQATSWHIPFDWSDMHFLHEMSLLGKVHITPRILFHAGEVHEARSRGSYTRRRIRGFNYRYSDYVRKMIRCIRKARCFTVCQKMWLLILLSAQIMGFLRGLEPALKPVKLPLLFLQKAILYLDQHYVSRSLPQRKA